MPWPAWAIDDALRAAGIEIPFPQRDLRIRSVFEREGEAAFKALGYEHVPVEAPAEQVAPPTRNDAADDTMRPEEDPPPVAPKAAKDRAS